MGNVQELQEGGSPFPIHAGGLGAVTEKVRSTSLSLSADSMNSTLSILSRG